MKNVSRYRHYFGVLSTASLLAFLPGLAHATVSISSPGVSSDATYTSYSFKYSGTPKFFRVYIDADQSSSTGYAINGIHAEWMVENGYLYHYIGSGTNSLWDTTNKKPLVSYTPPANGSAFFKLYRT